MLKAKWQFCDIETAEDLQSMATLFKATTQLAGAFDTETTGLHIIADKPFLFQFGWVCSDLNGYTFAVDFEQTPELARTTVLTWHKLAETLPVYLAHNVKYDLNMLTNVRLPYTGSNLSDTMFYIRYAHDARKPEDGGPPLGLKEYASQFIDGSAKYHEKLLDKEKSDMAKAMNNLLKCRLQQAGCKPPAKYGAKQYTLSVFEDMFKDPVFTADDLPEDAKTVYYDWLNNDVPIWLQNKITAIVESHMIPYNKLNRANLRKYAHYDIVWVLEIWLQLSPVLTARDNRLGVEIENQLIQPLVEMERTGFAVNKAYLDNAIPAVKSYILERRQHFYKLAGEEIKIGQKVRIREILNTKFNIPVTSTNGEILEQACSDIIRSQTSDDYDRDWYAIDFINTLEELRTLEKWYATYMLRFQKDLKYADRLYTTINQVGTVSGRVTSDFQQFPKDTLKTVDGVELFSPRKLIQISGGEYQAIVYLDYSQIELRFQAMYTILVGHPDTNLCRAYMPFKCHNAYGPFDYKDQNCIKHAYDTDWFYDEQPEKKWVKLDVHGATTKEAFGITEDNPSFKRLRYVGKRVNFAKNYGAQYKKICSMFPDRTPEECRRIDGAYYKAFPGVKEYHNYCYSRAAYSYTTNLFGIKYYNVSGHKLINMLVQGSAAFYLKTRIIKLYAYSKEHNLKTRWQMQIHDELSWEWFIHESPEIFFDFKNIMEDWPDGLIPIIADMEVTTKSWSDKVEVETLGELQANLSA